MRSIPIALLAREAVEVVLAGGETVASLIGSHCFLDSGFRLSSNGKMEPNAKTATPTTRLYMTRPSIVPMRFVIGEKIAAPTMEEVMYTLPILV